jgi:uncharacterized protein (TIGR02271 family)
MSQTRARAANVFDTDGLRGTFDPNAPALRDGRGQVYVRLEDGRQALVPAEELRPRGDGDYELPFSFDQLDTSTRAFFDDDERTRVSNAPRRTKRTTKGAGGDSEQVVVPVVAEQLDVQKRKVERGGVRIRKVVHEREEVIDEPLIREEVQVKRVPVGRVVDGPVPVRHVGDTMIISLLEEVLVVEKRLMLKEELHITKGEVETYRPQRVTLRTEEAHVERVGGEGDDGGGSRSIGGGDEPAGV